MSPHSTRSSRHRRKHLVTRQVEWYSHTTDSPVASCDPFPFQSRVVTPLDPSTIYSVCGWRRTKGGDCVSSTFQILAVESPDPLARIWSRCGFQAQMKTSESCPLKKETFGLRGLSSDRTLSSGTEINFVVLNLES